MGGSIGQLFAILGIDTSEWDRKIEDSSKKLGQLGGAMVAVGAVIAGALTGMMEGAISLGQQFSELSVKTGLPVESLGGLKLIAEKAGIGLDSIGTSMRKLSQDMVAAEAPGSKQAKMFEEMGIAVRDANGNFKPMDQMLGAIADRFKTMPDGQEKIALAIQLFGRAGMSLIPVLNEGSEAIRKNDELSRKLGTYLTADGAAALKKVHDEQVELTNATQGLGLTLGQILLPMFEKAVTGLTNLIAGFRAWAAAHPELIKLVGTLALTLGTAMTAFGGVALVVAKLGPALVALAANPMALFIASAIAAGAAVKGLIDLIDSENAAVDANDLANLKLIPSLYEAAHAAGMTATGFRDMLEAHNGDAKAVQLLFESLPKTSALFIAWNDLVNKGKQAAIDKAAAVKKAADEEKNVQEQMRLTIEGEEKYKAAKDELTAAIIKDSGSAYEAEKANAEKTYQTNVTKYKNDVMADAQRNELLKLAAKERDAAILEIERKHSIDVQKEMGALNTTVDALNQNQVTQEKNALAKAMMEKEAALAREWGLTDQFYTWKAAARADVERKVKIIDDKEAKDEEDLDMAVATAAKADIDAKVVGYDKELAKFDQVRDLEAKASMDAYEYGLYQIQSTLATKVRAYEDDTRESGRNHTTEIAVATATASAEEQLYKQQHSAWHVFIDDVASSFQTTFSDFVSTFPDFILKGKMVDFAKFFKNIVGDILKSFTDMVSSMVTDWIKRFLTDTLINSTAKAAATAAKSLTDVVGKGVEDLTGKAAAGVGQLANVGGQAVAGAATSVINTVANVVTAAASVLELLKGPQKQTDVTYWLKMIKDLDQETHDRIKDIVAIMVYEQAQGDEKWNFMNTLNGLVAAGNNLLGDIAGGIRSMCSKIGATFDSGITRISSPISGANLAGLEPEYVVPESKVPGFVSAMSSPSSGRVTVEAKLIPLNPMLSAWAIGFFPKATKDEIVTVHPNGVRRK